MPSSFVLRKDRESRRGQAIIEVLVAISVLTVGFLGIVTLLSRALSLNRVVSDNYTATYLASEGIEIVKNIIDGDLKQQRGWGASLRDGTFTADFRSSELTPAGGTANYLLFDPATNTYSYTGLTPTPFARNITITVQDQRIKVVSEVVWKTRGGGESKVNLEDYFYNWR